jgi:hypothetical protein
MRIVVVRNYGLLLLVLKVLAFTLSYLPFLLMALDIADTTGETGLDIMLFWEILLATQVLCVWVIFPILIVYYESNENDGAVSILTTFYSFRGKKSKDLCRFLCPCFSRSC